MLTFAKVVRKVRSLTTINFNILFNLVNFLMRDFFLGFDNANNFLKYLSKNSVLPILRLKGAKIGVNCDIESGITIVNCKNFKNLVIGDNCHIGKNCFFDLRGKIVIDDNVTISMNTTLITHQDLGQSILSKKYKPSVSDIKIHSNAYIGANSIILQGTTIGNNSIVAASSCIVKSVKPKTLCGGKPAKLIKHI